jgi:hypothetical protein
MIRTAFGAIVAMAATAVCAQQALIPMIGETTGQFEARKRAAAQGPSAPTFERMPSGNIRIQGTDLLVEWPKLIGKRVRVKGGRVSSATSASSMLQVKGGRVSLAPPWSKREQLRYVLNNCTGLRTSRACDMDVTGEVTSGTETAGPRLTRVRFYIPGKRLKWPA